MNKAQSKEVNLTTNEALILQQIYEDGGDDVVVLAGQVGLSRRTVMNILADLRRKGLMAIDQIYGDAWVRLTTRGKRLVQKIWPEAQMITTY
ncbi:MarR family winged helix-turn-helix transcriptional regulator [Candidatus Nanosynbacter sp. TM7-008]|uniref:MarR family winged helix-turn-helix transcriptional regulator n=1 Tax=Candidatus Nanosynbacter sp. TM7-008 TaxID=2902632 RepID=UPI001FB64423|nr:MarR family winged helix-turn-helix transcriptional regulator [Candidatus Nanosynbacter sp. TM7-008]MCJ1963900.1 MarR family winged helix-turn-helix transcriptional regulator [Candidatus Nanosynbacter sp. TM7-008]